jgi:hypothetical protein
LAAQDFGSLLCLTNDPPFEKQTAKKITPAMIPIKYGTPFKKKKPLNDATMTMTPASWSINPLFFIFVSAIVDISFYSFAEDMGV